MVCFGYIKSCEILLATKTVKNVLNLWYWHGIWMNFLIHLSVIIHNLIVPSFFRHKPRGSCIMYKFSAICWSINPQNILSPQNIFVYEFHGSLQIGIGSVTFSLSFKLSIFPMSLSDFEKASHSSVNNFCAIIFWSSSKWFKSTFGSHLGLPLQILANYVWFREFTLLSLQWCSYKDKSQVSYYGFSL